MAQEILEWIMFASFMFLFIAVILYIRFQAIRFGRHLGVTDKPLPYLTSTEEREQASVDATIERMTTKDDHA